MKKNKKKGIGKFIILQSAYNEILNTVGKRVPESGGILLGSREDYVVQKFVFDPHGSMTSGGYDPDVDFINGVIKKEWEENQLELLGFLHSHPRGVTRLSGDWGNNIGDLGYLRAIFKAIPALQKFLVPIMFSPIDGGSLEIFPYMADRDDVENYYLGDLTIIKDNEYARNNKPKVVEKVKLNPARLEGSIDFNLMQKSKVVCVGVGGANGVCESLVRCGLGNIVLIDFDKVDETNIVTQGFYVSDIGKLKVDALKERLLNINPLVNVETCNFDFMMLPEIELEKMMCGTSLLMMMTDSFKVQAFGNIVGLKYQIPTIFAMMYYKARCSEITFMIPGVTPGCHRCAVSSRYTEYEKDSDNDVTSTGSTNFHTTYLNSAIGIVALAMLHSETKDLEFSGWFGTSWDRNLIQLRTSPYYESALFSATFEGIPRVHCLDSIWQKIEPEAPPKYVNCPDCGGLGDLREAYLVHQK